MKDKKIGVRYDIWLLSPVVILMCIGVVMVYSSSSVYSKEYFGSEYFFIRKHAVYVVLGAMFFFLGMKLNTDFLKKLSLLLLGLSVLMLSFLMFSKDGVTKSGVACRWLAVCGFSFQPAELAKLSLVMFLAAYVAKLGDSITSFKKGFLPCAAVSGTVIMLIVVQPDFGTAVTLSLIVFLMLFVAGARLSHLLSGLALFAPAAVYLMIASPYRLKRVLAFFDPWKDPLGSGFQMIQSFIAFSNGGLFGQGLGAGKQKLLYLPEGHTDFIFSVVGEELGFAGVVAVVLLFGIFIYRGISISLRRRDSFSALLALGITSMIGIQAFIHMGVTMGLLPTKGLTLPFISYGGSSLVITMFASGILLNLSSRMNQIPEFNFARRV